MKYLIVIVVLIVFAFGAFYFFTPAEIQPVPSQTSTERHIYQNEQYGFSFEVPAQYDVHEYTDEAAAIGHVVGPDAFDSLANIQVYTAGTDVGFESYEDFVFMTLRNQCAADGPNASIACTAVEQRQPFTAASGLVGEVLYLRRVKTNLRNNEETTDGFGPIFIFNLNANVPESQFAIVAVTPPANLPADKIDSQLLRQTADTLQISRVATRQNATSTTALVSEIRSENDQTIAEFDPVEILSGEIARQAVASDTDCAAENAEECAPSLNNDFYIRNLQPETSVYPVASNATITLQTNASATPATIGDADLRIENLGPLPFRIIITNNQITGLEEVYVP